MFKTIISVVIVAILISKTASANEFQINAASCIPDSRATREQLYTNVSGVVSMNALNGGYAQLNCAIPVNITAPSHLFMQFSNSGAQTASASYVKVSKSTGAQTTIKSVSGGNTSGSVSSVEDTFSDTYDVSQFIYYVIVDVGNGTSVYSVVLF